MDRATGVVCVDALYEWAAKSRPSHSALAVYGVKSEETVDYVRLRVNLRLMRRER